MKEYTVLKAFYLNRDLIEPTEEGQPAAKVKLTDTQAKKLINSNHVK
jgi:hypothetical protein